MPALGNPVISSGRFYDAFSAQVGTATFFVGELLLSRLFYHFRLRDCPYWRPDE